jgi:16S rRNA (guanine1207-N2)-methyltransferase
VADSAPEPLDSSAYSQLRPVEPAADLPLRFLSKPGIFGWNKIDRGSALLVEETERILMQSAARKAPQDMHVLDLGCGYGYLLLALKNMPFRSRTATDNNAAAVAAARANFAQVSLVVTVTLDDCGAHLDRRFDLIVCNPPFHLGFSASRPLTEKFLDSIQRLLDPGGDALLVVNRFIPLERLAAGRFKHCIEVRATDSFRVLLLQEPLRPGRR